MPDKVGASILVKRASVTGICRTQWTGTGRKRAIAVNQLGSKAARPDGGGCCI